MKLIALFSAAVLATGTLVAAVPAEAQRYGYDNGHGRHGDYRRDYRRGRRGHDRGYNRGYGYRGQRGYGRSRVVCRVHRGYYGPERRCFRVNR